jgi:type IV pilus assembly protein PilC
MSSFAYVSINRQGKELRGTIEAASEEEAKKAIRLEGNIPISVMVQTAIDRDIRFRLSKPVGARDLSVFCRQFASILKAGVAIKNALLMMARQTRNKALSGAISNIQVAVEKGETLTNAMLEHEKIFPPILVHMVEAGEASGSMDIVFERMAAHFGNSARLKNQVKKAMIYPIIVSVVAAAVIFIMMIAVIPNFIEMFAGMDIKLPFMTRFVMGISNFFAARWYLILLSVAILIISYRMLKRSPSGKMLISRIGMRLPMFGSLTVKAMSSGFCRTLSTLLSTGVHMIKALEITAMTLDNLIIRQAVLEAGENVERGMPLSVPINSSGVFPPLVCDMIKIGEDTGDMPNMLNKAADYYDEEVKFTTEALTAAMEPMIIIILALIVGVLIMAMMQPMMSLYQSLGSSNIS